LSALRDYWTRTGHRERLTRALIPQLSPIRGTVLDVGGGRHAAHDLAWVPGTRVVRLDISSRHSPDVLADAVVLPLGSGIVDAVVMIEVLEHLSDPASAITEVHRVLRPGGKFVGSAPLVWPIHGDPHDYFRFTADGMRHLLARFDDVRLWPVGGPFSAAWILLASASKPLRVLNPLLRNLGAAGDTRCPEGYLFTAAKHY